MKKWYLTCLNVGTLLWLLVLFVYKQHFSECFIHTHSHTDLHTFTHTHSHTHIQLHTDLHTFTHTHSHTHTFTHTHLWSPSRHVSWVSGEAITECTVSGLSSPNPSLFLEAVSRFLFKCPVSPSPAPFPCPGHGSGPPQRSHPWFSTRDLTQFRPMRQRRFAEDFGEGSSPKSISEGLSCSPSAHPPQTLKTASRSLLSQQTRSSVTTSLHS